MIEQRKKDRPKTFWAFVRINAIEAIYELFEPITWLKNGIRHLYNLARNHQ